MSDLLAGLLIPIGVAALPTAIGFFLPRKKTKAWGKSLGRSLSKLLRQKLGTRGGEKVENRIQTTVSDFCEGLMRGLDEDEK